MQTSHRFITIIFASLITVLVIFGMSVFYKVEINNPEIIEIPKGSNTNSISNLLYQNKLILNPSLFKLYSRLTASDESYKAGEYLFQSPESIHTLIHKISDGNFFYRKLTILPGLSLNEILKLGSSPGLINDIDNSLEIPHQNKSISLQEGISFQILISISKMKPSRQFSYDLMSLGRLLVKVYGKKDKVIFLLLH